ncbi:hypothetical protein KJ865_17565, partial [Myxococcota bacterium]|nr:hypothetical protein [Myxococcota bacterium]
MNHLHPALDRYLRGDAPHIEHRGVVLLPILHEGMEWASAIHTKLREIRPVAVGIELPETLNPWLKKACALLPGLAVLRYQTSRETPFHVVIESTDPLWEAVRTATEMNIPVSFIDKDLEDYPLVSERWPDSFTLAQLGYDHMVRELLRASLAMGEPAQPPEEEPAADQGVHLMADHLREETMAFHLWEMRQENALVVGVVGLHHVPHILNLLDTELVRPFGRVKRQ